MKKLMLTLLFAALVMALAACGGDDSSSNNAGGSGETVDLTASNWQFDKDTYTVPAGKVTFNLKNEDGYHGIEIEGTDVKIEGEGSDSATLEAGEYTIKCSVPCGSGHDTMTTKLVVE
ncbi:cytochrome C oxidase subunit II [Bacillaceae bacterium S4-13-58]